MRKKEKALFLLAVIFTTFLLNACQKNPDTAAVVSKNDGSFDANAAISASEHHDPDTTVPIAYTRDFTSTNGSVEFRIRLDEIVTGADMPIVEVQPHYITETEAKRIAQALFGNAELYEKDSLKSRAEIQQCIMRWTPYANRNAMQELLPPSSESSVDFWVRMFQNSIEAYTKSYESAPEENPHAPCQWTFHKDSYYSLPVDNTNPETYRENDSIQATTQVNGIPYHFWVSIRQENDYKLSFAMAYPQEFIVGDKAIYTAQLCRTEKPSASQMEGIRKQAESMLEQMAVGEWLVDECYLETTEREEYIVHVDAVPKLNGVPAMRVPQLSNLNSDKIYASSYYITNVSFRFSPQGDLLYFEMQSPIDVSKIINDNVAVMDMPELLERVEQAMSLSDIYEFDFDSIVEMYQEQSIDLGCLVEIHSLDHNLIRVKKPNTEEEYYYIPGIVVTGDIEYYSKATGDAICKMTQARLLALNAVDGSVININQ